MSHIVFVAALVYKFALWITAQTAIGHHNAMQVDIWA